jgi:phosphoribosylglycinamide formyltransferase-1
MSGEPGGSRTAGRRRLGILISGRGSNMHAILEAVAAGTLDATVGLVISNVADAAGLQRARQASVPTLVVDHREFPTRAAFDAAVVAALRGHEIDLVCLAGFMRLLGPTFIDAFPNAILNIHPSLLPAFPGLHAQRQALCHGAKISGATVHLVDAALDAGPIVLQAAVAVRDDDTEETLSARILVEEHRLYPSAIALVLGEWHLDGRRFIAGAMASAPSS